MLLQQKIFPSKDFLLIYNSNTFKFIAISGILSLLTLKFFQLLLEKLNDLMHHF